MANTTESITLKLGLDTTNFNNSLKGLTTELKALQKIDLTILSQQDAQLVVQRMGGIKDEISMLKKEMTAADPDGFFNSFSVLSVPAMAAIGGLGASMEIFGVKSEVAAGIQQKMLGVVGLLGTAQTLYCLLYTSPSPRD